MNIPERTNQLSAVSQVGRRHTIGVLASWQVYEGAAIGRYLHTLLRGVQAAASDRDCNLLLACGIGAHTYPHTYSSAWPAPAPGAAFVPVGPWNTDGLIVAPHMMSAAQSIYVHELLNAGYPLVFVGPEEPGPAVVADNIDGVCQAVLHLVAHGHQQIAYVAGHKNRGGDSALRLQGYQQGLQQAGLIFNPHLIVYGEHNFEDGQRATEQLLARDVPFTGLIASNDHSCLGAMTVLQQAGRRIPEDVAVIGFDDILDARAHTPPLTTVRHPTFALGYESLRYLLDLINGVRGEAVLQIPTRLVIRRSCGCSPGAPAGSLIDYPAASRHEKAKQALHNGSIDANAGIAVLDLLAQEMANAVAVEARYLRGKELFGLCQNVVTAYFADVERPENTLFQQAIRAALRHGEALDDDAYAWHSALSVLEHALPTVSQTPLEPADLSRGHALLAQARQEVSERVRRQTTRALVHQMDITDRLGLMTAQLLNALDATQVAPILAEHLPRVGVKHLVLAQCAPVHDDPVAQSTVVLAYGLDQNLSGHVFPSRDFPPPSMYPQNAPLQLALLPFSVGDGTQGFAAFDATHLEPCAAVVQNVAAALRSSDLYRNAAEGRRLAEEANNLKSRFLSMVSHELRTPLSLIVGLSELLLREHDESGPLHGNARQDVTQIYTSAQHLGRLIGDVLDLASDDVGQLRLTPEPLDILDVLRPVVLTGAQMAREKGLAWAAELPPQGQQILGDRTRLRQIFLNLLSNAVKFTATGGVTLSVAVGLQSVSIIVSDTGVGILPDEQVLIFDEFSRSERATSGGYSGMGLGLAICKRLVDLHGGTLTVASSGQIGSGSIFTVTLPTLDLPTPNVLLSGQNSESPHALLFVGPSGADPRLTEYLTQRGITVMTRSIFTSVDEVPWNTTEINAVLLDQHLAETYGSVLASAIAEVASAPLLVYTLAPAKNTGALMELRALTKPLESARLAQALQMYDLVGPADGGKPETILLVDDNADLLALHTRAVQALVTNYDILQARNGHEALRVMQTVRPALVLLDLMMPELDGFGVLEAMRADERLRSIPVLVLTARALNEFDIARLNQGVAAILSKGLFSLDETLAHIEHALSRPQGSANATRQLVRRAIAYIHTHYAETCTREEIAAHVGVHPDYFTDCFHREMGIPPTVYLSRYRIHRACELLHSTQQSVTAIAYAVGFTDSAYFSRAFQRTLGVTPSAYRRGQRIADAPTQMT